MDRVELMGFEAEVARRYDLGECPGPVHLCSETQIEPLLEIFKDIKRTDYVLSTWRAHFHALLHGVPPALVMSEILAGRSMMLHFPEYRFMSSAIMGGMLPIACGLAAGGFKVHCFLGDMCESTGAFKDARAYASGHDLDVTWIVEDNGLSTNTPTRRTWGPKPLDLRYTRYEYNRTTPHYGTSNGKGF